MNLRRTLALLLLLLVAGGLLAWNLQNPEAREIRRIRQRLLNLAETASFQSQDNLLLRAAYPTRLAAYFADPTEFDIDLGDNHISRSMTLSTLQENATILRNEPRSGRGLTIEFLDLDVRLHPDRTSATTHLTSKIRFVADVDYWVQELRLDLRRSTNHAWVVHRVQTVRTMQQ